MKRAFLALALLFLAGCEPEFSGQWNGHCLEVRSQDSTEYCFGTIRQAAIVMNVDYAVARAIFINAQTRYMREVARERARNDAQR